MTVKKIRQIAKVMQPKIVNYANFLKLQPVINVSTVNCEPKQTMTVRINDLQAAGWNGTGTP